MKFRQNLTKSNWFAKAGGIWLAVATNDLIKCSLNFSNKSSIYQIKSSLDFFWTWLKSYLMYKIY